MSSWTTAQPPDGRAGPPADHAARAASFGAQAAAYADVRPGYPDIAVQWVLEPVADGEVVRVLDLAAGTGKLTEALVRSGASVVAVEPDPAMVAELRRRLPGVRALSGRAEEIPLPASAFDAVVVGHAFHWFDLARALPEIARVLRPGGVVAGLWNFEDERTAWVEGFVRVAEIPGSLARWRASPAFPAGEAFAEVATAEFTHHRPHTVESATALVATHSHALVMADDERAQLVERVRGYLRERPETGCGRFELPVVTAAFRTVRV